MQNDRLTMLPVPDPGSRLPGALLCAALCLAGPAAAQIYKWVDDKGVTHYGERPPQGQKARPVDATPPTTPAKPQASRDWEGQNIEFQKRRIQREQQAEREDQEAKEKQKRCFLAKDDLRGMESAERLYDLNDKGERIYLDAAAHRAAIERQRELIARNCP